jgi:hypothetical protein
MFCSAYLPLEREGNDIYALLSYRSECVCVCVPMCVCVCMCVCQFKPYTILAYVCICREKRLLARWLPHEYLALFFPSQIFGVPPSLSPSLSLSSFWQREGVESKWERWIWGNNIWISLPFWRHFFLHVLLLLRCYGYNNMP